MDEEISNTNRLIFKASSLHDVVVRCFASRRWQRRPYIKAPFTTIKSPICANRSASIGSRSLFPKALFTSLIIIWESEDGETQGWAKRAKARGIATDSYRFLGWSDRNVISNGQYWKFSCRLLFYQTRVQNIRYYVLLRRQTRPKRSTIAEAARNQKSSGVGLCTVQLWLFK